MKYLLAILLIASPLTDLDKIAKVNKLKKEAKQAYNDGKYQKAIDNYTYLLDSMKVEDENITLNLANAYYQLKDSTNAVNNYESLLDTKDKVIKSVAHQQLGVMANRGKKFDEALNHFKNAIRANPKNDEARYNYEMLKKMLDEQEKQQDQQSKDKKDQNKDQEQKDKEQQKKDQENQQNKDKNQQNKDQKDKEGEKKEDKEQQEQNKKEGDKKDEQQKDADDKKEGEEKKDKQKPQESDENKDEKAKQEQMESFSDKLKEMKISEEKAKMILEALKNNEIQYIQQNRRKPSKRKDPNKPDW